MKQLRGLYAQTFFTFRTSLTDSCMFNRFEELLVKGRAGISCVL